jgi:hypothetical protein
MCIDIIGGAGSTGGSRDVSPNRSPSASRETSPERHNINATSPNATTGAAVAHVNDHQQSPEIVHVGRAKYVLYLSCLQTCLLPICHLMLLP